MAYGAANYHLHVVHLIMCFLLYSSTVGVLITLSTNELFRAVVLCGLLYLPRNAEGFLERTVILLAIQLVRILPGHSVPSKSVIAFSSRWQGEGTVVFVACFEG